MHPVQIRPSCSHEEHEPQSFLSIPSDSSDGCFGSTRPAAGGATAAEVIGPARAVRQGRCLIRTIPAERKIFGGNRRALFFWLAKNRRKWAHMSSGRWRDSFRDDLTGGNNRSVVSFFEEDVYAREHLSRSGKFSGLRRFRMCKRFSRPGANNDSV